jgi:small subunit ribosomal protein S13
MIYVLGTTLNDNKKIVFELASLYGIGKFQAVFLCNLLNFGADRYSIDLRQTQIYKLLKSIDEKQLYVENTLQKQKLSIISDLINIKCYRGSRHIFHLPTRGQRTRTNAQTKKRFNKTKYKDE